jgi:hypothetical protein
METTPKSPQEMAVQIVETYPYFNDQSMPEGDAEELHERAGDLRLDLEAANPYALLDEQLEPRLAEIKARATESGVWDPTKGDGADERIAFAVKRMEGYGYTGEVADAIAMKDLRANGLLYTLRNSRRGQEGMFKDSISRYVEANQLDHEVEKQEIDSLLDRTIDISTLTSTELAKLSHDFPAGNFLYHGAGAERLVKIIDSGTLANAKALHERETQAAKAEGREAASIYRNTGYEGVSWSMNGIDALPGDRYHLAGFIGAPETVLSDTQQFVVPSRPAPNEVLQISSAVEADKYYDAKTQFELYRRPGIFGESNSAFDNLASVGRWEKEEDREYGTEPMLYQAKRDMLAQPGYQERLRELYNVQPDGTIRFDPDLLEQINNEIPVATVWLQAAMDTGRLNDTVFAGKEVPEIIETINSDNVKVLFAEMKKDWQPFEETLDEAEKVVSGIEVPIENMYFVAPRKDAGAWLKVIARSKHKPAGILLYDDKKIRLENFASSHRGHHAELTDALRAAIQPGGEGYIDYTQVLGAEFSDDMRAGVKHQVIAEKHLTNRKTIKKIDGKLVVGE